MKPNFTTIKFAGQYGIYKITAMLIFVCLIFLQQTIIVQAQEISAISNNSATSAKLPENSANPKQIKNELYKRLLAQQTENFAKSSNIAAADGDVDLSFNPNPLDEAVYVEGLALQSDGKILVGGIFTQINGRNKINLARLNSDGSVDDTFTADVAGLVTDIVIQPDGKILIGGSFNFVGGQRRSGIARLNSDGSLDTSFDSGTGVFPFTALDSLTLQADGKILIGGNFTAYNGVTRNSIARLNSDGSLDTTFDAGSGVGSGAIYDIVVQPDGKILIGGSFSQYNGTSKSGIARVNANGSLDTSFSGSGVSRLVGNLQQGFVNDIELLSDGKILIAGGFLTINGIEREAIARLNSNGSVDTSFDDFSSSSGNQNIVLYSVDIESDGNIIVGGNVTVVGSFTSNYVLRIPQNGRQNGNGVLSSFAAGNRLNNIVLNVLVQPDGKVLAAGIFTKLNSTAPDGITRFNSNGSADATFNVGSGATNLLPPTILNIGIQTDGKIIVCGNFELIGGGRRNSIARLNVDGTLDNTFDAGNSAFCSRVLAIQADGKILAENAVNSQLLRLNPNGSVDASFTPNISFPTSAAVQPDGKILYAKFLIGNELKRLNSDGSVDATFMTVNPGSGINSVDVIVVQPDGKILIGGIFTTINGTPQNRVARLNSDGTLDTTFNVGAGANDSVPDLELQQNGKILISGRFTTVNGIARDSIARLNADGSLDASFDAGNIPGFVNEILLLDSGKIIVGGQFNTFNGVSRRNLVRLNSDGSLDSSFVADITGSGVSALAQQGNGNILIGGLFTAINNIPRNSLARLLGSSTTPNKTLFDFDGDGKADISVFRPSNSTWYLNQSQSGFTGAQFGVSTDKLVPADYDGDGRTDLAVYRSGIWYLNRSQLSFTGFAFGAPDDVPVPADYDGDGKADLAVWRPSNGTWYVYNLVNNQFTFAQFGGSTDKPIVGDFNGDGNSDYTVFRPSNGTWYVAKPTGIPAQNFDSIQFGLSTDTPVAADYDGDGKTDVAVFRPSNGTWYLLRSQLGFTGVQFGISTDLPTPADYDGDGRADIAVFRSGTWYLNRSTAGFTGVQFGASTDQPVPNAFVP